MQRRPSTSLFTEPAWQPVARFTAAGLPPAIRYWLLDDGSLTSRLIAVSGGQFEVRRRSQLWQTPLPSERRLLELAPRDIALVREVCLYCAGTPVVFARSVFPLASLTGALMHLRKLNNQSLGAILFKHPGMHRSPFELAHGPGNMHYIPEDLQQDEPAWGRRSRFTVEGKSLMVSEVFLRGFKPWPPSQPVHRSQRGKVSAANQPPKQ